MLAVEVIPPAETLTQKISQEKEKLRLMRQRNISANNLMADYQKDIDKLREDSDQAFYLYTSQPSEEHDKLYADAQAAVNKLLADYEESQAVKRRLPDRLKTAERLIHSLQRQKQSAVEELANKKLGKRKEIAMQKAGEAICTAVALTAATSPSGDLDRFMGLGDIDTHSLVSKIISTPLFRENISKEFKKLVKTLKLEEV